MALTVDDDVPPLLVRGGFDPVYGARSIRREIRHEVWPLVANAVIGHRATRPAAGERVQARLSVIGRAEPQLRCVVTL